MSSTIISHFSFESICVNNIFIAIIKLFFFTCFPLQEETFY
jgi:hypothetical protein